MKQYQKETENETVWKQREKRTKQTRETSALIDLYVYDTFQSVRKSEENHASKIVIYMQPVMTQHMPAVCTVHDSL